MKGTWTMQKLRNKDPIYVGDLVKCLNCESPEFDMVGLVLDRIHYDKPGEHPDSYSCRVLFDMGERMIRAKWLRVLSKNLEKEETVFKHKYETKV